MSAPSDQGKERKIVVIITAPRLATGLKIALSIRSIHPAVFSELLAIEIIALTRSEICRISQRASKSGENEATRVVKRVIAKTRRHESSAMLNIIGLRNINSGAKR